MNINLTKGSVMRSMLCFAVPMILGNLMQQCYNIAGMNILLDLWFVLELKRGAAGAAQATVISQYLSGLGIAGYTIVKCPWLRPDRSHWHVRLCCIREIAGFSVLMLSAIPSVGVTGIWWSVPIGWILADITGFIIELWNSLCVDAGMDAHKLKTENSP